MPTPIIHEVSDNVQYAATPSPISPRDCPHWYRCNTPVCPLEPFEIRRVFKGDERVCFFLTEAQKDSAEQVFEERGLGWLYRLMIDATPVLSSRSRRIKHALKRSKSSGNRMLNHPGTREAQDPT
jgi:hypothetical protein